MSIGQLCHAHLRLAIFRLFRVCHLVYLSSLCYDSYLNQGKEVNMDFWKAIEALGNLFVGVGTFLTGLAAVIAAAKHRPKPSKRRRRK